MAFASFGPIDGVPQHANLSIFMKSTKKPAAADFQTKANQFLAFAREQSKYAPSWIDLQNALFGIGAKMSELFPERGERTRFMQSDEFQAIMAILHDAQGGDDDTPIADLLAKAERDRRASREPAA
jgi:hypothetical protein